MEPGKAKPDDQLKVRNDQTRKTSIEQRARTQEEKKEIEEYLNIVRSFVTKMIQDLPDFTDGLVGEFSEPETKDERAVGIVASHVTAEHRELLENMCGTLAVTQKTVYSTFRDVAKELFLGDINWGRIVLLIAFAGTLSRYCMQKNVINDVKEEAHILQQITAWTAEFMHDDLGKWINEHDRWRGFRSHFAYTLALPWLKWIAFGSIGVASVIVLGKAILNHLPSHS